MGWIGAKLDDVGVRIVECTAGVIGEETGTESPTAIISTPN